VLAQALQSRPTNVVQRSKRVSLRPYGERCIDTGHLETGSKALQVSSRTVRAIYRLSAYCCYPRQKPGEKLGKKWNIRTRLLQAQENFGHIQSIFNTQLTKSAIGIQLACLYISFGQLLYDTFSVQTISVEWWMRKDLEESGSSLVETIFRHLPQGSEKNHEKPQSR
jgi:hypothetical protein